MPKGIKAFRLSDPAVEKLDHLAAQYGTLTAALEVAIDRLYQQEVTMLQSDPGHADVLSLPEIRALRAKVHELYTAQADAHRIASKNARSDAHSIAANSMYSYKAEWSQREQKQADDATQEYIATKMAYNTAVNRACYEQGLPPYIRVGDGFPGYGPDDTGKQI